MVENAFSVPPMKPCLHVSVLNLFLCFSSRKRLQRLETAQQNGRRSVHRLLMRLFVTCVCNTRYLLQYDKTTMSCPERLQNKECVSTGCQTECLGGVKKPSEPTFLSLSLSLSLKNKHAKTTRASNASGLQPACVACAGCDSATKAIRQAGEPRRQHGETTYAKLEEARGRWRSLCYGFKHGVIKDVRL